MIRARGVPRPGGIVGNPAKNRSAQADAPEDSFKIWAGEQDILAGLSTIPPGWANPPLGFAARDGLLAGGVWPNETEQSHRRNRLRDRSRQWIPLRLFSFQDVRAQYHWFLKRFLATRSALYRRL